MLDEVISSLSLKPGDIALDATIGGGGHSILILKRIQPGGILIGLDADASAVKIAQENLKDFRQSVRLVNENFRNLDSVLSNEGVSRIDAALFDVGISSYQMDDASRGFSFQQEARLDMRMDPRLRITAHDIVNRLNERELSRIIKEFGEERFHNRIARFIAQERSQKPIETTSELKSVIRRAVGSRYGHGKIDPATRTFQALRIAVNDELAALEEGLKKAVPILKSGGRICVISFHSLEDRIVKNFFRANAATGALKIITKKPLRPSAEEVIVNPRSRSAKLRVAERL
jgi:16S rRNA (cytosine1402-N4)-methyltransferase